MEKKKKDSYLLRKNLANNNKAEGITLIALVITIIVLLILAAVSIATLTGENGILTKATRAEERTKTETEKEQIGLAYNAAMADNDGKGVTQSYFETELKKYDNGTTVEQDGENFKVTYPNENVYTVKKDGTIEKATNNSGSTATQGEINAKIGQIVEYEINTKASEDIKLAIGDWRVFYASDTEMFLISSQTIVSKTAFGGSSRIPLTPKDTEENYDDGAKNKVFQTGYGLKYNEKWLSNNPTTDKNANIQATAYLCDSKNWTDYVGDTAPAGTYAVGGPTKELLVRSWVASGQTKGEIEADLKEILDDTEVSDAGYTYNKPSALYSSNPIKNTILPKTEGGTDGLYNNGSSYWLASPSSNGTINVCYVNYSFGFVGSSSYDNTSCGACPLVSIPISNVKIENGIVTIESN